MEEAESRAIQLRSSRTLLQTQLEELKKQLDEEVKVRPTTLMSFYFFNTHKHLNQQNILDNTFHLYRKPHI